MRTAYSHKTDLPTEIIFSFPFVSIHSASGHLHPLPFLNNPHVLSFNTLYSQGDTMTIKPGIVVSHPGAVSWGVGKVMEVSTFKATIQFSDGISRKIASSHYGTLLPADPASFVPTPDSVPADKVRTAPKKPRKTKLSGEIKPDISVD